jgi:DNA-binding transcriptional regulator/RsmH inhibitor MraZ
VAENDSNPIATVPPPLNIDQASVDDKGRLKLTSDFLAYLQSLGATTVFITTLDLRIARVYPMSLWESNENFFRNAGELTAAAERIAFLARVHGGKADIDGSGRVLLPAKLREALGLEKQPVWLEAHNGRINVMTRKVYDERMQLVQATMADDLKVLEKAGVK